MKYLTSPVGLRQGIACAQSVQDINDLLTIGSQFQHASPRTVRSWEATAKRRIAKLNTPVHIEVKTATIPSNRRSVIPILHKRRTAK